jgi:hypothetical protein
VEQYLREALTSMFTLGQRQALAVRQIDLDRTVEAIDQLDRALVAAASGREGVWRRNVADAIEMLHSAVSAEAAAQAEPDSLLSDIARTQPRLRNRVRGVRAEYGRLCRQIGVASETVGNDPDVGVFETRMHLGGLLGALQLLRGRESDLIYEAYFDAFNRDVEDELSGRATATTESATAHPCGD